MTELPNYKSGEQIASVPDSLNLDSDTSVFTDETSDFVVNPYNISPRSRDWFSNGERISLAKSALRFKPDK